MEWMGIGGIEQYGPRGNDAFTFQLTSTIPDPYLTGELATSWVFNTNPLSLTFYLRQGVYWTGNANIGMQPREFTAADAVFGATRAMAAPANAPIFTWVKDVVAVDEFTERLDFTSFNALWELFFIYGANPNVPFTSESATAGGSNWRNQVGTGPFILTDYVSGADATYTRNPNYWGTTTINGKTYQMPFINTLIYPVITDPSTELAALRTGKIDLWSRVPFSNSTTLAQTSPNLIQTKWTAGQVDEFYINRLDGNTALSNLSVRQALMEATDFNTIMNLVYGGGNILGFPVSSGSPYYTPLAQQPAVVQQEFTYNPTQAEQMLAAAGYPNGFTTSIYISSADPIENNIATIINSEWAKIHVTATINAVDPVALTSLERSRSYNGFLCWSAVTTNPVTPISLFYEGTSLGAIYKTGEPLDVEATKIVSDTDQVQFGTDVTQFCKDALTDAGFIPFADPYILNCYWPWVKNYYGEVDAGYHNQIPMISRIWIDQNLKTSLGH
jgi:peptide/nickel transport system substrate-binding protein